MKKTTVNVNGFEEVVHFEDDISGLNAIVAIHSTQKGPSLGGCRFYNYANFEEALLDATRLAQGMTYKNVLADLPHGGGKAVIIGDPSVDKSPELLRAFGDAVESLGGAYITGEDVGMKPADLSHIAERTRFATGIPNGELGGDPSPFTALGVFYGMQAAARHVFGKSDLKGLEIAVAGLGNVGYALCRLLHEAGADLFVADINAARVDQVTAEFGARSICPATFMNSDVDILAPCALGGAVNDANIRFITAPIIAGSANNQLSSPELGIELHEKNILYAPDYVINSGGVISVAYEFAGTWSKEGVTAKAAVIGERLADIFTRSSATNTPTSEIADQLALSLLGGGASAAMTVPSIAAE